ncbi:gliding motility-associated C-terminal domain-containing protein [Chitinophagaceae bacterium MMS25-I14]
MKKIPGLIVLVALGAVFVLSSCKKSDSSSSSNMCSSPAFFYRDSAVTVVMPNAFTPNGDGKNDVFHVVCTHPDTLTNFSLTVYNQSGGIEFQTTTPHTGWAPTAYTVFSQATYQYSVSLHFTSPTGRTIDTCEVLYRLPVINGCNIAKDTADVHKFVFEDQVDAATAQSPYPTGDNICLLQ